MNKYLIHTSIIFLLVVSGSALAGVDGFESTEANHTIISSRIIDGVTITLSNESDMPFYLVTYYDAGSNSFIGANDGINEPADPTQVSLDRFISTRDDINADMPIVFDFDVPVGTFGLTTIDVLEDVETSADAQVRLKGYNDGEFVTEHVITGFQGGSGVVVNWVISSDVGFTQAMLVHTAGTISAGYGIDDLVAVSLPVPTENTSFGQVKALFR